MAPPVSVASPRQHIKSTNSKKHRLTPKQCREVTDHWKSRIGEDQADGLIKDYINATRLRSAKETACRVQNDLTHRFQQDWSVLATHSTARHRNPRRNGGSTFTGVSHTSVGQPDLDPLNVDPAVDGSVVYGGHEYCDQKDTRPRPFEISLADFPMKVRKPKQRKARGYEVLPSVPRVSSVPPSEHGEQSFHHEFETMSNFSWDAVTSDNLSVFSEDDWEDLESAYTHETLDYELDRDLKLLRMARDDSDSSASSPSTTPPQRTYAQALANKRCHADERQD
ncbi:hypothetical protein BJ322DRAFT_656213 [Thelephora terrestris]|uniref:Uncharacterized protein n=1 Tax=Thelephora terrestris TaxID=56493 RepID=A0A9P6HKN7_9AGAM|nr:hypothetical protein BJ322DRAFT_656213 [Thelephora terrestris]